MVIQSKPRSYQPHLPATLVLVTNQFACDRLIRVGRRLADFSSTELRVLTVMDPKQIQQSENALEYLFGVSREHGAVLEVLYSDNPKKEIIAAIKNSKISNVVTGEPENEDSILYQFYQTFLHINFFTVSKEGQAQEVHLIRQNA